MQRIVPITLREVFRAGVGCDGRVEGMVRKGFYLQKGYQSPILSKKAIFLTHRKVVGASTSAISPSLSDFVTEFRRFIRPMPDIISHEYYGKKDPPKLPNNNGDFFDFVFSENSWERGDRSLETRTDKTSNMICKSNSFVSLYSTLHNHACLFLLHLCPLFLKEGEALFPSTVVSLKG